MLSVVVAAILQVSASGTFDLARERMGLRVVQTGGRTFALGGYSYVHRQCSTTIEEIIGKGTKSTLLQMLSDRNHFEALAVSDNQVLVAGGFSEEKGSLANVELLDFHAGKSAAWPNLLAPIELFTMHKFGHRAVLFGGLTAQGITKTHSLIQWIDFPTQRAYPAKSHLITSRFGHDSFWVPSKAKFLIVGGKTVRQEKGHAVYSPLRSMEWFEPATEVVTQAGELIEARDRPKLVLAPNGKVWVIGGADETQKHRTIEEFDPDSGKCRVMSSMCAPRMAPMVLEIPGRGVLIAGGWTSDPESARNIEFLPFSTGLPYIVGKSQVARAEGAMVWLDKASFAILGGKDDFGGRNPHSYELKFAEIFTLSGMESRR